MTKYHEPTLINPRELTSGDLVGCHDAGPRLQLLTGGRVDDEHGLDEIWVTLCNEPNETAEVWGEPVRSGSTALFLGEDYGWRIGALPQVWARRRVAV